MNKRICFLDMDGVLTDFVEQVRRVSGYNVEGFQNRQLEPIERIIQNKVFHICDHNDSFWRDMPPTQHAQEVVQLCKSNFDEVRILSRFVPPKEEPSRLDVVRKLKTDWLKKTFNGTFNETNVIVTDKPKYTFIEPEHTCILIDDTLKETRGWIANGGKGIWYRKYEYLKNYLEYSREQRRGLCRE